MNQVVLILLGLLLFIFGIAQGLQCLGLIGTKTFSLFGVGFTLMGIAGGIACFKNALAQSKPPQNGPPRIGG